ncbi:MAG: folate-binding protein YgfZ [Proteobacteria bacterium]|nr:folate-binding protein YgfZ [Pseudomonadota bacterium]
MTNSVNIALLQSRAVLRLAGADRFSFLQNLISQDLKLVEGEKPIFTALLTPQGKYLFDFFVLPEGEDYLLDVEAGRSDELVKLLTRYRLRANTTVSPALEFSVYAIWGGTFSHPAAFVDPRLAALGQRLLAKNIQTNADEAAYAEHRYELGVAEGSHEISVGHASLAEVNFDALNGVSFEKGCYMGQELTARMHYRGLVKKRYLPFRFEGLPPRKLGLILHNGFEVGEIKVVGQEHGLGLFHLEATQPFLKGEMLIHDGTTYEISMPDYLKEAI